MTAADDVTQCDFQSYKKEMEIVQSYHIQVNSYIDVKKKQWLKWQCRYFILRGNKLWIYNGKIDAKYQRNGKVLHILNGGIWENKLYGIQINTLEDGWIYGCIENKHIWAKWLQCFLQLE